MWNKIVKRFYETQLRCLELDNHTNPIRGMIVSAYNGVNLKQKPRFVYSLTWPVLVTRINSAQSPPVKYASPRYGHFWYRAGGAGSPS